jgi:type 1 glutamine amidotransferase
MAKTASIMIIGILCMAAMVGCRSEGKALILSGAKASSVVPPVVRGRGPSAEEIKMIEEAMPAKAIVKPYKSRRLLVIDLVGPRGFYHDCIPYWNQALAIMAQKTGAFTVTFSSDPNIFKAENLNQFDAVCFNNTVSLPIGPQTSPELCKALMDFIQGGKGWVGIHAATDSFYTDPYKWPEAEEMMGGKFTGHPWTANGTWAVKIDEPNNPLMAPFKGQGFKINDEIYRTEPPLYSRSKQLVLMSLDMSDETTEARAQKPSDADTGISWIKSWGDGRVFYCSLGHVHAVTWTAPILEHYLRGIQFALGDLKVDTTPKGQADKQQ